MIAPLARLGVTAVAVGLAGALAIGGGVALVILASGLSTLVVYGGLLAVAGGVLVALVRVRSDHEYRLFVAGCAWDLERRQLAAGPPAERALVIDYEWGTRE